MKKEIISMLVISFLLVTTIVVSSEPTEWEAEIWITETGGRHDYIIIGEKLDASDDVDSYDVPKCPPPPSPFVRAYIYHDGLQYPYNILWFEYRNSTENVYKEWKLRSMVFVSDPTNVIITWDKEDFCNSSYQNVFLCDSDGEVLVDMKIGENYTYESEAYSYNEFIIKTIPNSIYDVNNDGQVNFQDAGIVWIHRAGKETYDSLYDVNDDRIVDSQDVGIVWKSKD